MVMNGRQLHAKRVFAESAKENSLDVDKIKRKLVTRSSSEALVIVIKEMYSGSNPDRAQLFHWLCCFNDPARFWI